MIAAVLLALLACGSAPAFAAVRMPEIYGDNMVLQTNEEYGARAFLNGEADANELVTITANSAKYEVNADTNGNWKVMLNPTASKEDFLTISVVGESGPTLTFRNISYGDVYICSGQSNMVFPLNLALNSSAEIADAANWPNFRLFTVGLNQSAWGGTRVEAWMSPKALSACEHPPIR